MWFSGFFSSYFVSHSWGIPMMKITGLSHLFKWENLHNWWLTKYFFAPLYIYIYVEYTQLYPTPFIIVSSFITEYKLPKPIKVHLVQYNLLFFTEFPKGKFCPVLNRKFLIDSLLEVYFLPVWLFESCCSWLHCCRRPCSASSEPLW